MKTVKDFLSFHPLTRYPHYSRYVARMMSGEKNVLMAEDPAVFAVTSGTSGNSNIIPMAHRQTKLFFLEVSLISSFFFLTSESSMLLDKQVKIIASRAAI